MLPTIYLWKYNPITGYWVQVRACSTETQYQWLAVFQCDEPDSKFKLSKLTPRGAPK